MRYELGTKAAIVHALGLFYPGTEIEEWFEYGGDPYYFRVIIDVTDQKREVTNSFIRTIIDVTRNVRSLMNDDKVIVRSRNYITFGEQNGYVFFSSRLCGTFPKAAVQGKIFNDYILVGTNGQQFVYASPKTGAIIAGTFPSAAYQGRISEVEILLKDTEFSAKYSNPKTGNISSGSYPIAAKQGVLIKDFFLFESDADSTNYTVVKTGIVPAPSKLGTIMEQSIESIESADNYSYAQSVSGTIDTGTFPDASVAGGVEGGNISFDQEGILTAFNAHACGTLPGSLL